MVSNNNNINNNNDNYWLSACVLNNEYSLFVGINKLMSLCFTCSNVAYSNFVCQVVLMVT